MKSPHENKTNDSHWFDGFRYAGLLPSIAWQRTCQANLLCDYLPVLPEGYFLSIGVGCGSELEVLVGSDNTKLISVVDTIDISSEVAEAIQKIIGRAESVKIEHIAMDVAELVHHPHYGEWNVIQCGFVLQDVPYAHKQEIFDYLFGGLRPGGLLLISEMFLDNRPVDGAMEKIRCSAVSRLYDCFLQEIDLCVGKGVLDSVSADELRGDEKYGLVSVKRDAVKGLRDYLETQEQIEAHLLHSGFSGTEFYRNPINPYLGIIASSKGLPGNLLDERRLCV